MDFVFHELIQISSVGYKYSPKEKHGHSRLDRRKGAAMLGLCTFGKNWSKADDNHQENPGSSKRK